jgi:hypothetical protein
VAERSILIDRQHIPDGGVVDGNDTGEDVLEERGGASRCRCERLGHDHQVDGAIVEQLRRIPQRRNRHAHVWRLPAHCAQIVREQDGDGMVGRGDRERPLRRRVGCNFGLAGFYPRQGRGYSDSYDDSY